MKQAKATKEDIDILQRFFVSLEQIAQDGCTHDDEKQYDDDALG